MSDTVKQIVAEMRRYSEGGHCQWPRGLRDWATRLDAVSRPFGDVEECDACEKYLSGDHSGVVLAMKASLKAFEENEGVLGAKVLKEQARAEQAEADLVRVKDAACRRDDKLMRLILRYVQIGLDDCGDAVDQIENAFARVTAERDDKYSDVARLLSERDVSQKRVKELKETLSWVRKTLAGFPVLLEDTTPCESTLTPQCVQDGLQHGEEAVRYTRNRRERAYRAAAEHRAEGREKRARATEAEFLAPSGDTDDFDAQCLENFKALVRDDYSLFEQDGGTLPRCPKCGKPPRQRGNLYDCSACGLGAPIGVLAKRWVRLVAENTACKECDELPTVEDGDLYHPNICTRGQRQPKDPYRRCVDSAEWIKHNEKKSVVLEHVCGWGGCLCPVGSEHDRCDEHKGKEKDEATNKVRKRMQPTTQSTKPGDLPGVSGQNYSKNEGDAEADGKESAATPDTLELARKRLEIAGRGIVDPETSCVTTHDLVIGTLDHILDHLKGMHVELQRMDQDIEKIDDKGVTRRLAISDRLNSIEARLRKDE